MRKITDILKIDVCASRMITVLHVQRTEKFNPYKLLIKKLFMDGKAIQFYQLDKSQF